LRGGDAATLLPFAVSLGAEVAAGDAADALIAPTLSDATRCTLPSACLNGLSLPVGSVFGWLGAAAAEGVGSSVDAEDFWLLREATGGGGGGGGGDDDDDDKDCGGTAAFNGTGSATALGRLGLATRSTVRSLVNILAPRCCCCCDGGGAGTAEGGSKDFTVSSPAAAAESVEKVLSLWSKS
jgi:hypothetical protein